MITWEVAAILLGFFAMVAVVGWKRPDTAAVIIFVTVIGRCVSNCIVTIN